MKCYEREHVFYLFVVGIPTAVILIALPGIAVLKLLKEVHGEGLTNAYNVETYGFIYDGYQLRFWLVVYVVIFLNVIIIIIFILLSFYLVIYI